MAHISDLDKLLYFFQSARCSGGNLAAPNFILESYQDNITAYAGGGQANATAITAQTSRITTATAGSSVQLPVSVAGLEILVINHGANPVQVFGSTGDTATINDAVSTVGVSQMQNSIVVYTCATPGQWYSIGLGEGFVKGLPTVSTADTLTATGSTQGTAYPIATVLSRFTTVAASTGALAPATAPGLEITVMNAGANPLTIYGAGTDQINVAGTQATTYSLAAGHTVMLYSASSGVWHGIFS